MSFVYPAGLWALLGLALLVAVCLVRRNSELTPVSSTYLWRLSDQRRKKNRHLRRLKRALYFLLHAFEIALAALLIAHPLITMPGSGVDVAVIMDASASMRMTDAAGETLFGGLWWRQRSESRRCCHKTANVPGYIPPGWPDRHTL